MVVAGAVGVSERVPTQPDGVIDDRTPNHCSAPHSSNRCTSVNPSVVASRRARLGGVSVSPRLRQEQIAEFGLPGVRTDLTPALRVAPVQLDDADHRPVDFDHEESGAPPGYLRCRAFMVGNLSRRDRRIRFRSVWP